MTQLTLEEQIHIANVAEGSSLDYFAAAVGSTGEPAAAYLLLAHMQAVSSVALWAGVLRSDRSREKDLDRVSILEQDLRYELLLCMRGTGHLEANGPFPATGTLPSMVDVLQESVGKDFPRALSIGVQESWERPFSNVYQGPPQS